MKRENGEAANSIIKELNKVWRAKKKSHKRNKSCSWKRSEELFPNFMWVVA